MITLTFVMKVIPGYEYPDPDIGDNLCVADARLIIEPKDVSRTPITDKTLTLFTDAPDPLIAAQKCANWAFEMLLTGAFSTDT